MTAYWPSEPLGAVCDFDPSKSHVRNLASDTPVSFIPMNDLGFEGPQVSGHVCKPISEVYKGYTYFADGDILLAKITPCFENGKLGIASGLKNSIGFGSSEFMVLRPGPRLSARYLMYFLSQDRFRELGRSAMTGAVGHKRIPKEWVQNFEIPVPPLVEQQRIVAILDEAFQGIATAAVNAEKHISFAQELRSASFQNLYSSCSGTDETLSSHVDMLVGFPFKSAEYTDEPEAVRLLRGDNVVPGAVRWTDAKFLASNRVAEFERYQLRADDIVIAMDRPWIKSGLKQARLTVADTPSLLVQRVARLRCRPTLAVGYLQHLISSALFEGHVLEHAGGSGVPHISGSQLGAFAFVLPCPEDQALFVKRLDEIESYCAALIVTQKRKLVALAELKQSLLARAYSGALAHGPFVLANDNNFSSPEQVANILAVIHWRHEKARRDKTYGHVKAQKALHLVEHIGGVELGREPIKDVAGPNDFEHMKRAEKWAKDNLFFEFVERPGGGYEFKKLSNHGALLSAAKQALKPIEGMIDRVSDLIVPMDSEAAEVLATVHAAWNNLLAEGREVTPDAIVREARDDWRPSKMLIAESKFRDAIKLIRAKGIIPDGTAKPVLHRQPSLL